MDPILSRHIDLDLPGTAADARTGKASSISGVGNCLSAGARAMGFGKAGGGIVVDAAHGSLLRRIFFLSNQGVDADQGLSRWPHRATRSGCDARLLFFLSGLHRGAHALLWRVRPDDPCARQAKWRGTDRYRISHPAGLCKDQIDRGAVYAGKSRSDKDVGTARVKNARPRQLRLFNRHLGGLFRLQRSGRPHVAADPSPDAGKFQLPLRCGEYSRFLAALAHHLQPRADRVYFHSRLAPIAEVRGRPALSSLDSVVPRDVPVLRILARTDIEFSAVGSLSRPRVDCL